MAVIAVLVAVAIPTFGSQLEKARQATDRANLRDAYASAKIAIQTSDETTGTIKSALTAGGVDADDYATGVYTFWYNADGANDGWTYAGTTATATVGTPTAANALLLKATTATDLDKNALPGSVTYAAKPTDVTTAAGVLIQIAYNKYANVFTLAGVGFSKDGKDLIGGLQVATPTLTALATAIPAFSVKEYPFSGSALTEGTNYKVSADPLNTNLLKSLGLVVTSGALALDTAGDKATSAPSSSLDVMVTLTHTDGRMTVGFLKYTKS